MKSKDFKTSHPTRVRGLKFFLVARTVVSCVAPYTGAWIEINSSATSVTAFLSHPTRVRGLKFLLTQSLIGVIQSHPTRVRGLK